MRPDEAKREDARAWMAKASLDLRAAEHASKASSPLLEDVTFHAQQAAEKAMKALLTWHDVPFRKTHSLEELGRQCLALDPAMQYLVDEAAPLSEYAWKYRYPGEPGPPTGEEAADALRVAHKVVAAALERLPPEVWDPQ